MLSIGTGTPPRYGRRHDDVERPSPRSQALLPPARRPAPTDPIGPVIDHMEEPPPHLGRGRLVDILV